MICVCAYLTKLYEIIPFPEWHNPTGSRESIEYVVDLSQYVLKLYGFLEPSDNSNQKSFPFLSRIL